MVLLCLTKFYFFVTDAKKQSLLVTARWHMVRIWSPGMCEWQNWRCVAQVCLTQQL